MANETDSSEVLRLFKQYYGFPSTYLVLDTETTGFSWNTDFCVDLGWAVVKDNQVVHRENLLLDWSKVNVDHDHIRNQLEKQAYQYDKLGRPHYYSWQRLCDEGVHPLEAIYAYSQLIYDHIVRGDSAIVGHGLWRFDRKMIDAHTQKFLQGYQLPWQDNSIIDTGLLEKAIQTNHTPWPNESLDDWLHRVNSAFAKAKWNLGDFCAKKYALNTSNDDMQLLHTAAFDCILTQRLIEVYKQMKV